MAVLEARNISIAFNGFYAVRDVSFSWRWERSTP